MSDDHLLTPAYYPSSLCIGCGDTEGEPTELVAESTGAKIVLPMCRHCLTCAIKCDRYPACFCGGPPKPTGPPPRYEP